MRTRLIITAVVLGFFAFAGAAGAAGPIFQMSDGSWYHPSSGLLKPTKEGLLTALGATEASQQSAPSGVPAEGGSASGGSGQESGASSDPASASTLKEAVTVARAELQKRTDAWHASGAEPLRVDDLDTYVDVTLAVWNQETDVIDYVDVKKNGTSLEVVTPVEYGIRVARTNGVNSQFTFDDDGERVVVAVKYPIFKEVEWWHYGHSHTSYDLIPIVYTPWSKRLHTPEMVAWGKETLVSMLNDVYAELNQNNVRSLAFPDKRLTDVIAPDLVQAIAVSEHLGLSSLTGPNGEYLMDTVFVVLAGNQEKTYAYSRSSAGAKGIAQFIPSTYEIVKRRTELNLEPDFEAGMADVRNGLKAMVAYLDAELDYMPSSVRDLYYVDIDRVHEYLAAAYNAGGVRVRRAILMWGDAWSEPHAARDYYEARATLRNETVQYVQKIRAVKSLLRKPVINQLTSGTSEPEPAPDENLTKICFSDGCHWVALHTQTN